MGWRFRFNAVVLRARFDESNAIKDMRVLAQMLEDGEKECWREQHYDPSIIKNDPGGICYNREAISPDWVIDQWHPWEKVQTLDFFEKSLMNTMKSLSPRNTNLKPQPL